MNSSFGGHIGKGISRVVERLICILEWRGFFGWSQVKVCHLCEKATKKHGSIHDLIYMNHSPYPHTPPY
jgi:hypothetical protein